MEDWEAMKTIWVACLALGIGTCGAARGQAVREDLGLRAFALQQLFKSCAKTNEVCYVAFSSHVDPRTRKTVYADPPPAFLTHFAKCPFKVRAASDYPAVTNGVSEANAATGIPDGVYTVQIIRWIDDSTAQVRLSMYRSETWARGHDAIVERQNAGWEVREYLTKWSR